jgi:hypothetical protein
MEKIANFPKDYLNSWNLQEINLKENLLTPYQGLPVLGNITETPEGVVKLVSKIHQILI